MRPTISKGLFVFLLGSALAASLGGPACAEEPSDVQLQREWSQQMEQARQKVLSQDRQGLRAEAVNSRVGQKGSTDSDAARRKELSRSLLQEQITNAETLAHWYITVPTDQTIVPHLAWWNRVPIIGDKGYGEVKFDIVYKGVREKLTCELNIDDQAHVVRILRCTPPLFYKAWPKNLRLDPEYGALFGGTRKTNTLVFYVDLSAIVP